MYIPFVLEVEQTFQCTAYVKSMNVLYQYIHQCCIGGAALSQLYVFEEISVQ